MLLRKSGQGRPYLQGNPQMLPADQWPNVLANIQGTVVRGTERVSSNRLMDLLDVGPDPAIRQKVGKRLVGAMRRAGWSGPRPMRIPGENGHQAGCGSYWRSRTRPRQTAGALEGA